MKPMLELILGNFMEKIINKVGQLEAICQLLDKKIDNLELKPIHSPPQQAPMEMSLTTKPLSPIISSIKPVNHSQASYLQHMIGRNSNPWQNFFFF